MNNAPSVLPLFPLPVFLLPGGLTRLRVFEPRYLKLVKIATKGNGFVMSHKTENNEVSQIKWGSLVEIVNFDQDLDGVLQIDVKCKALVEVISTTQDTDNLYFVRVSEMTHWSQDLKNASATALADSLDAVFDKSAILKELYVHQNTRNDNWVIARWLELLPVEFNVKNTFVEKYNYEEAKNFVQAIVFK